MNKITPENRAHKIPNFHPYDGIAPGQVGNHVVLPNATMKVQPAPIAAVTTLGELAHRAIAQHCHQAMQYEQDILKDHDPEPLHQMRVGLRRLRTALQVFAGVIELPPASSSQKVGKIARCLGTVRDWDVMAETLGRAQRSHLPKPEQATLKTILASTAKQRQHDFGKLEKIFNTHYKTCKHQLMAWIEQPSYQPIAQLPIHTTLPDLLLPLISQLLLHPAWLIAVEPTVPIAALPRSEQLDDFLSHHGPALHDLRKQIKRVRYQTEFFRDCYDDAYSEQVAEFKLLQETLGTLQDCTVLQDYLARHLKADPQQLLPTFIAQLDRAASAALSQWRALQSHYLQPDFRAQLRSLVLTPNL